MCSEEVLIQILSWTILIPMIWASLWVVVALSISMWKMWKDRYDWRP